MCKNMAEIAYYFQRLQLWIVLISFTLMSSNQDQYDEAKTCMPTEHLIILSFFYKLFFNAISKLHMVIHEVDELNICLMVIIIYLH